MRIFVADLGDRLAEQVREHVEAARTRIAPGLRIAGGGDPDRQLGLHRPRQCLHRDVLAERPRERDLLAAPQLPHVLELREHDLLRVGVVLGPQHEVVRVPTRRGRDPDASVREVVDDRPFLGDPDRVVQRHHATARANLDVLRHRRDRGAGDRRIRIRAAERVEVTLGCPHRAKPFSSKNFAPSISSRYFAGPGASSLPHMNRPSPRPWVTAAPSALTAHRRRFDSRLVVDDDLEAARQRPEQLEHRDVERQARDREPNHG